MSKEKAKISKAYGLYISIEDLEAQKKKFAMVEAGEKVEVCVQLDDVAKNFTYEEFAQKLGF